MVWGEGEANKQTLVAEVAVHLLDVHVLWQREAAGEMTTDEAVLVGLFFVLASDQQEGAVLVLVVHLPMYHTRIWRARTLTSISSGL